MGECLSALPLLEMVLSEKFVLGLKNSDAHSRKKTKARIVLSTTTPAARQLLTARLAAVSGLTSLDAGCMRFLSVHCVNHCVGAVDMLGADADPVHLCTNGPSSLGREVLRHLATRVWISYAFRAIAAACAITSELIRGCFLCSAGLWIESELWPNLILEAAKRQV